MNYKLALKLKEVGFKCQHDVDADCVYGGCRIPDDWDSDTPSEIVHSPTLEELIEACGNQIASIRIGTKRTDEREVTTWWYAYSATDLDAKGVTVDGATPTEAVANLWIEINKK